MTPPTEDTLRDFLRRQGWRDVVKTTRRGEMRHWHTLDGRTLSDQRAMAKARWWWEATEQEEREEDERHDDC
jgi:hypothetical protein